MKKLVVWNNTDIANWKDEQSIQRSYLHEVVSQIEKLKNNFTVSLYGDLNYEESDYPLHLIQSKNFDQAKPNILITGGVHGYETSGVHGALLFMKDVASKYESDFNFFCVPCISPWGYETINRWNPKALDPNRNFFNDSPALECELIYKELKRLDLTFLAHFDLHETTDTDNSVFRPALEKRDGVTQELWDIPDGFYLVGDTGRVEDGFQESIISEVEKVTHIAPADKSGKIIGVEISRNGVINYDVKKLFLCAGLTDAKYVTTTEVYPDSLNVTDKECNRAQVAAVIGGLKYLKNLKE
jgi:hypothetical protein